MTEASLRTMNASAKRSDSGRVFRESDPLPPHLSLEASLHALETTYGGASDAVEAHRGACMVVRSIALDTGVADLTVLNPRTAHVASTFSALLRDLTVLSPPPPGGGWGRAPWGPGLHAVALEGRALCVDAIVAILSRRLKRVEDSKETGCITDVSWLEVGLSRVCGYETLSKNFEVASRVQSLRQRAAVLLSHQKTTDESAVDAA
jgi:hypothetical protein